jgi:hypothetical protein
MYDISWQVFGQELSFKMRVSLAKPRAGSTRKLSKQQHLSNHLKMGCCSSVGHLPTDLPEISRWYFVF